jgi:hypothetical protein
MKIKAWAVVDRHDKEQIPVEISMRRKEAMQLRDGLYTTRSQALETFKIISVLITPLNKKRK